MRILLGVTGCIAAYKACEILRELQRADADVRVVMTEAATRFVGAPTFAALSGHPVGLSLFDNATDPIPHIRLAEECDAFLIAPCTANVVAKLAGGIADDLLTSTALACTAPLMVAPAMNVHMYENAATQSNLATLRARACRCSIRKADASHAERWAPVSCPSLLRSRARFWNWPNRWQRALLSDVMCSSPPVPLLSLSIRCASFRIVRAARWALRSRKRRLTQARA